MELVRLLGRVRELQYRYRKSYTAALVSQAVMLRSRFINFLNLNQEIKHSDSYGLEQKSSFRSSGAISHFNSNEKNGRPQSSTLKTPCFKEFTLG
jgi:hypothetical protein